MEREATPAQDGPRSAMLKLAQRVTPGMRPPAVASLALALALLVITPPGSAETSSVSIRGSQFAPNALQVVPGDLVVWTNEDSIAHSIVSDNASFAPSAALQQGGQFVQEFPHGGRYTYHCGIHSAMAGVVFVFAGGEATPPPAISSPPENGTVSGIVRVSGNAPTPSGASSGNATQVTVEVQIDGGEWHAAIVTVGSNGARSWTYDWDTRALTDGMHTIVARVTQGERSTLSAPRSLTVANGPAATTPATPGGGFGAAQLVLSPLRVDSPQRPGYVTVALNITNLGSVAGEAFVTLLVNGTRETDSIVTIGAGASEEVSWRVTFERPGSYVLHAALENGARSDAVTLEILAGSGEEGVLEPLPPWLAIAALALSAWLISRRGRWSRGR